MTHGTPTEKAPPLEAITICKIIIIRFNSSVVIAEKWISNLEEKLETIQMIAQRNEEMGHMKHD